MSEWQAYDKLDPIGSWRQDFNTAQLSSLILNIVNALYQDPKKAKPKDYTPAEFMPIWDAETEAIRKAVEERQTPDQMREFLLGIAETQNARIKREERVKAIPPPNLKKK